MTSADTLNYAGRDSVFVIMAYDFAEERVQKALKIGRKYLKWVQNSLFEGDLTVAKFEKLKAELRSIMDEKEDSVKFYILRDKKYVEMEYLGVVKEEDVFFL